MKYNQINQLDMSVSALGLGTWVMGGWLWGGSEERDAEEAIEISIENGVTLIDTAPVYGFGKAEEIVGRVIRRLDVRDRVQIATKFGLEWDSDQKKIGRNSSRKRLLQEIDDSRRRLQTDVIDLYQIHWPDEGTPFEETLEELVKLFDAGVIRGIGVSNFDAEQMHRCLSVGPIHTLQPPYNLFERDIEDQIVPFCLKHDISILGYGSLCRGLLTGKFNKDVVFEKGDVRSFDPKFDHQNLPKYLAATDKLKEYAKERSSTVGQLAIRWASQKPGVVSALAGARTAKQAAHNAQAFQFDLNSEELEQIENIVENEILVPVGPEFMAPPRS